MTFRAAGPLVIAALCPSLAGVGCPRVDDGLDRVPPRVVSVTPALPTVPVTTSFDLVFSEEIEGDSIDDDPTSETVTIVLVPRALVTDAFLSDVNNPPLIESRQDDCVPVDATIRGDRLEVTPSLLLTARTAYTLLISSTVRDLAGNPIVDGLGLKAAFRYDFDTDAGAPAVAATDVGTGLVAPNRRRLTITFNQPVRNVGDATVQFSPAVPLEAVLLDESRTTATVFVAAPASGCARFVPNTAYTLSVTTGVVGDTDQALQPFSTEFTTGAACDETAHQLIAPPEAIVGEVSATVRFGTNKPSTTLVRFGLVGGDLDCLGAPCPLLGASVRQATAGSSPLTFEHAVDVTGLTVNQRYRVVVSSEDDVGGVATGAIEFLTEALPKLAVNEVMADPDVTENTAEFIELVNFGDVDLDLSGWRVNVTGNSQCTATIGAGVVVPPGGFLLVVGNSFLPEAYGLGGDVALARSSGANICGSGLLNAGVQVVVVEPAGRPITSAGKHVTPKEGRSTERIAPEAPDVASSFCLSRSDAGPSPGRQNGVVAQGCEQP